MKIYVDTINKNIASYDEACLIFPAIGQYERGEIGLDAIASLSLTPFTSFGKFLTNVGKQGYAPLMDVSWEYLRAEIAKYTISERLRKYIQRRTEKEFLEILSDGAKFDRLFNGAWKSPPKPRRNGLMGHGTRKQERLEGLREVAVPLINYIIGKDIDVRINLESFYSEMQWYTWKELSTENVPRRELEFTNDLLGAIGELMDKKRVDFRKLNIEYVLSALTERIRSCMKVEAGAMLKCVDGKTDKYNGKPELLEGKLYKVVSSNARYGTLMVEVVNEMGRSTSYRFSHFEDVGRRRDDLISSLFDL